MAGGIDDATIVNIQGPLNGPNVVTSSKPIIFKVDDSLRRVNPEDYEPKIVSIGPIHHGKEQVKSMEEHKERLLQELLAKKKDLTENMLIEEVKQKELDARGRYSPESVNNGHDFLRTMMLDGCFIIQLIRNYFFKGFGDPIFERNTLIKIVHDLLLFENQLPFFVLTALFDKIKTGNPDENLHYLTLFLVADIVPWLDYSKATLMLLPEPNHLLALVYRCISTKIPSETNGGKVKKSSAKRLVWGIHINSASELKEIGGIHLKRSEDNRLTFASKVLKLPPFQISDKTEPLLRNLMAYEQLQLGDDHPRHLIDYMFFFSCLARSTKDIEMLRYRGIIINYLGRDKQIHKMIGELGTHFMISPDYTYSDVCNSLNNCCSNRWNGWMADLEQTHFNTPWSMIKFGTGLLVLAITVAQLTFAALTYFTKLKRGKL